MKAKDMERVADLVVRVYKGEDPTKVRREATRFRRQFNRIFYT
jgi:glycine/serine hydroxymethyltransferase